MLSDTILTLKRARDEYEIDSFATDLNNIIVQFPVYKTEFVLYLALSWTTLYAFRYFLSANSIVETETLKVEVVTAIEKEARPEIEEALRILREEEEVENYGRQIKKLPKPKLGVEDGNVLKPRGVVGRKGKLERSRKVIGHEVTMKGQEGGMGENVGGVSIYEDMEVDG